MTWVASGRVLRAEQRTSMGDLEGGGDPNKRDECDKEILGEIRKGKMWSQCDFGPRRYKLEKRGEHKEKKWIVVDWLQYS